MDADASLEILIRTLADAHGADEVQAAIDRVKESTTGAAGAERDAADAGRELAEGHRRASEGAEHSHLSHRMLHQVLHLISKTAGPEAGAAVALAGVQMGAGIGAGVMAAHLLVDVFEQAIELGRKANEEARKAVAETTAQANEARKTVEEAGRSIKKFWEDLDHTLSQNLASNVFKQKMDEIKNIAKAAEDAGLVGKGGSESFVEAKEQEARVQRAKELTGQLNEKRGELDAAMAHPADLAANEQDLARLKADADRLKQAFEQGTFFAGTVAPSNRPGISGHLDEKRDILGYETDEDKEKRQKQFEAVNAELQAKINALEGGKAQREQHVDELKGDIQKLATEIQSLGFDIRSSGERRATQDFVTAKAIADQIQGGRGASADQQQFLMTIEGAITGGRDEHGRGLTLAKAVELIERQSANSDVAIQLLGNVWGRIEEQRARLDQLEHRIGR